MTITYDPTGNGIALPVVIVSGGGGGGSTTSTVDTLYVVVVEFVDGSVTNHVGDYIQQIQVISNTGTIVSTTWTNLTQGETLATAPAAGYISATSANPLTDAQLRATPVAMTSTQLPPALGPQTSSNAMSVYVTNQSTLDNFPIVTQYVAKTASTGVSVGDYVQDLEIYDASTDPATLLSSTWTNITQGTTLAGAPPANTLVPLSGTGLTDAQLRATPVEVSSDQLPTTLGQTIKSGSVSVAIASDNTVAITSANQLPSSLGQKVMASSLAVTLASDQTAIPVTIGSLPTTLFAAQQTVSTTAAALGSNVLTNGVVITADPANAGTVWVGKVGVTTSTGYSLAPGQSIAYAISNSNAIYIIGSNLTDKVAYTGN